MAFFRKLMQGLVGADRSPAAAGKTAAQWRSLGNTALSDGRLDEAVGNYRQALEVDSTDPLSHLNLGYALLEQAAFGVATQSLMRAISLAPAGEDFLHDAHYLLGRAWRGQDESEKAIASFRAALAARPAFVEAELELAQCLHALGRPEESLAALDSVLAQQPGLATALEGRGTMLLALDRPGEALLAFDAGMAVTGATADTLANRAAALAELGREEEALAALDQALAIEPGHARALYNQGHALCNLLRVPESLAVSDAALQLHPGNADLTWNRAVARLLLGDMAQGWRDFEARWQATALGARKAAPRLAARNWTGNESLQGQSIILFCEQGLGDTIQFLRFVPVVADRARQVFVRVQPPLARLAATMIPANCVVLDEHQQPAGVDFQCSLMSLPLALGVTEGGLGSAPPYLRPDPVRLESLQRQLAVAPGLRVGLAWAGNPQHRNDRNRSLPLALLQRLAVPGVSLVTVQPNLPRELTQLPGGASLLRLGDEITDFTDTAALLGALDLVITVDTSVAHLAGALGRPTWILLPFCPDWRWMLERRDTPWYPTARLFRQSRAGNWEDVLSSVAQELASMVLPGKGP